MKKVKRNIATLLLAVILLLTGSLLIMHFSGTKKAYAASDSLLSESTLSSLNYAMEKDTFAYGNTKYHINEYYGSLYGRSAISSSKTKIEFLQSDGITSLIPVAVFSDLLQTSSGVFTHMGKEWGVIIDFFSDSQEIRHYIVQVIDINRSDNVDGDNPNNPLNQSGRYLVEVRPLFEVEFIWLTDNSGKVVANLDNYVGPTSKYYGEYTSIRDYTRTGSGNLYAMPEYLYYYYNTVNYSFLSFSSYQTKLHKQYFVFR